MTHLWLYSGSVNESVSKLTLETEGPDMDQQKMARYRDEIEFIDDNHWILSSQILTQEDDWAPIMTAHHYKFNQTSPRARARAS